MNTPRLSRKNQPKKTRTIKTQIRINEEPETIAEYRQARPDHTAADWIREALDINNQHCSDDAIAISNLLYCAVDALKATKP